MPQRLAQGLEPEVQRLVAKHKADVRRAEVRAREAAQAQLDAQAVEHESYVRQLRERLVRERDDLLEKERAGAAERLRDATARAEHAAEVARQRLRSEFEARLDEATSDAREARRGVADAVKRSESEAERRAVALEADTRERVSAAERAHEAARAAWERETEQRIAEAIRYDAHTMPRPRRIFLTGFAPCVPLRVPLPLTLTP